MKRLRQMLSLLLALLLALPMAGFAAEELSPIEALGAQLLSAQQSLDLAQEQLDEANSEVAALTKKYDKNPNSASIQDQLIDAMIAQEEAEAELLLCQENMAALTAEQALLIEAAECEELTVEYDGKYADLAVTAQVDENMVIYALSAQVDGSERDQLVGENSYLYQFLGKDIPLTIGTKDTDDVAPLSEAQQTSKDLVAALNSLVYQESADEEAAQGPIIEPQAIADYIFEHGELPDNFITKKEAQALGWDSSRNYVSDVAPGKSIGGDRFGNYEGLLPDKNGRKWYEADCYYTSGKRNAYRILYSSDGLVYYTDDHYKTFTQMFPSK